MAVFLIVIVADVKKKKMTEQYMSHSCDKYYHSYVRHNIFFKKVKKKIELN